MSLAILFHLLCAQHVSDINISIIRSLRLFCSISTLVVLFLVRCVLEFRCGWVGVVSVLQAEAQLQHVSDINISETCWAHKKWNKIAGDIKLVFYSSTITMVHGPIHIRSKSCLFFLHCGISNAYKYQLQKQKYINLYKLNFLCDGFCFEITVFYFITLCFRQHN